MTVQIVVPRKVYTGNDVASAFNVSDDDGNAIWFSANSEDPCRHGAHCRRSRDHACRGVSTTI